MEPEPLGLDEEIRLFGKHSLQREPALRIGRRRRLARRKEDTCTGDGFTLAIVDEPHQFTACPSRSSGTVVSSVVATTQSEATIGEPSCANDDPV